MFCIGHLSRQCQSTSNCRLCKGRHHTSICGNPSNSPSQPTNASTPSTSTQSNSTTSTVPAQNPQAPAFTSTPTSTSLYVGSSKAVLLQTALAEVYNPTNPSLTLKLTLILDSGSQRSYLTEQVKNNLRLQRVKQQHLSISTFGASRGDPRYCEVVHIGITTRSGQDEVLELLIVLHICEPLSAQSVDLYSKMFPHLAPLTLADTHHSDTLLDVDMLIGSDFYWQLTTG